MKLGTWLNFQKLHIYSLSTPMGPELNLFALYKYWFPRYVRFSTLPWQFLRCRQIFKIAIFGHEIWSLKKNPKAAHTLSFYPKGSKLSLFSLYGQRFPKYGPILKIAIFGHETWSLTKDPEVAHIFSAAK